MNCSCWSSRKGSLALILKWTPTGANAALLNSKDRPLGKHVWILLCSAVLLTEGMQHRWVRWISLNPVLYLGADNMHPRSAVSHHRGGKSTSLNSAVSVRTLCSCCQWQGIFISGMWLSSNPNFLFLKILFVYVRKRVRERMRWEKVRERSRIPMELGTWWGTWSRESGMMTWAEGSYINNWATQPHSWCLFQFLWIPVTQTHTIPPGCWRSCHASVFCWIPLRKVDTQ